MFITTKGFVEVTLTCPQFNFDSFPFDEQVCHLIMYSQQTFLNVSGIMKFLAQLDGQHSNVQFAVKSYPLEFKETETYPLFKTKTPVSYFGLKLKLKRLVYPYISHFICTELLVIASWVSYLVPYDSIPGRMSPIVTVLLALINIFIKVADYEPALTTITYFEWFMMVSIIQVSLTLW